MAFLLHVEFDASSEMVATKMLGLLARMADIVRRDHPEVYTYVFRQDHEEKCKLIFTELYGNEQVFLDHARDPEFSQCYRQAFNNSTGQSRKELCIRIDINEPLMPITANILNHYLHVDYIPVEQGFLHRFVVDQSDQSILIVCTGCDEHVYEQLNKLVNCVTCITFATADQDRQLLAVIVGYTQIDRISSEDIKPSINTMELVCSQEGFVQRFQDMMRKSFQIQSLHVQTNFSGYIHQRSS